MSDYDDKSGAALACLEQEQQYNRLWEGNVVHAKALLATMRRGSRPFRIPSSLSSTGCWAEDLFPEARCFIASANGRISFAGSCTISWPTLMVRLSAERASKTYRHQPCHKCQSAADTPCMLMNPSAQCSSAEAQFDENHHY